MEKTDVKDMSGTEIYQGIEVIKNKYLLREIDYDFAKESVEVLTNEINRRGKEIAKKYGKRYSPVTSRYVLR